ncbi:MAG: GNAT family N-acetyltransferase [Pyrinomonadaceae bacterium]|nr:GNAT family N-acetyltransferase [Pyrinomonadaceae bacterium]
MMSLSIKSNTVKLAPQMFPATTNSLKVTQATSEHEEEVLAFLAARPIHTVFMTGFIRNNGLVSPLNRGTFYICVDAQGQLEGVALIGHNTLIEARTETALAAFARLIQASPSVYMMMGEREMIHQLSGYCAGKGRMPRLVCREMLLVQRWPAEVRKAVPLRPATMDDLPLLLPVHAEMAFEESGVNPLKVDPEGFSRRCARRIDQERVWVWVEGGRLLFKADILADTPEVIYLEGIYVAPDDRCKSYGSRCLSQLSRSLLKRAGVISVLVDERNLAARSLFRKAGYNFRSQYETVFLEKKTAE